MYRWKLPCKLGELKPAFLLVAGIITAVIDWSAAKNLREFGACSVFYVYDNEAGEQPWAESL